MRNPIPIVLRIVASVTSCFGSSRRVIRKVFTHRAVLHASPAAVFPLLCPIREMEWIENWKASVLYSQSGVAEDNGMFATRIVLGETWVTSRYEPETYRVEYIMFGGGHVVMRMNLALEDNGDGTCRWSTERIYTGLDWLGRRVVGRTTQREIDEAQDLLARQLDHFLAAGTTMKSHRR